MKFKPPFIKSVKQFFVKTNITYKTKIGIHVRRGDILKEKYQNRGYTVAPIDYIQKAMEYYMRKFRKDTIVFLVASDDLNWCRQYITGPNVMFSPFRGVNAIGEDLAMLSSCEHSIITTGTFGWMGARLAGGDVVYYKNFPRPGSKFAQTLTHANYYPPKWIGLL